MGLWYFLAALVLLLLGYAIYGLFMERIFGIDPKRATAVSSKADGIDYVALPPYKIFFIQLLNIAGLGPVFGPILGALYGPSALLWVVLGCIFAGAVHDFFSGAMSLRYGGASYPELIGRNLGPYVRFFLLIFTIWFMILVGAVFVNGPAGLLAFKTLQLSQDSTILQQIFNLVAQSSFGQNFCQPDGTLNKLKILTLFFAILIFIYYFMATILPIDKIIGHIYPIFAILLIFMAVGLFLALLCNDQYEILPKITLGQFVENLHPKGQPLWPMLFVTIACGAISGFHATQSPMMARCMQSESQARPMFYGVMVAEGVIALIWVTIGLSFYGGDPQALATAGKPPVIVAVTSEALLGSALGGTLVFLGVVILPISTGDTAFRTGRLILADVLQLKQNLLKNRLLLTLPLFVLGIYFAVGDFTKIWMAFGWTNQTLSCVTLWAICVFLARRKRLYLVALLPACFMTMVSSTYLFCYEQFPFGLSVNHATYLGCVVTLGCLLLFFVKGRSMPVGSEKDF